MPTTVATLLVAMSVPVEMATHWIWMRRTVVVSQLSCLFSMSSREKIFIVKHLGSSHVCKRKVYCDHI